MGVVCSSYHILCGSHAVFSSYAVFSSTEDCTIHDCYASDADVLACAAHSSFRDHRTSSSRSSQKACRRTSCTCQAWGSSCTCQAWGSSCTWQACGEKAESHEDSQEAEEEGWLLLSLV